MDCEAERLFQCQRCGQCCHGYGGTYVTPADIAAIAAYLGCPTQDFAARYGRLSCGRILLAQGADGYCIFYHEHCTIHPVKPLMCRRWPFIPAVLRDVTNWHAMAAACPGMRTDVCDDTIRAVVAKVLDCQSVPAPAAASRVTSG